MTCLETHDPALVPAHSAPGERTGWADVQHLIWYQEPLMIAFGTPSEPYVGFASSEEEDRSTLYFCFPLSEAGLAKFMDGGLDVASAVSLAGGCLYYSADLQHFRKVEAADMPEDDRIVLGQTGRDYADLMDRPPFAAA